MTPKYVLIKLKCKIVRPIICGRAARATVSHGIALTLTFMVTVGCLTVLLYPFVVSFFRSAMFRVGSRRFTFMFGLYVDVMVLIVSCAGQGSFLFGSGLG